MKTVNTRHQVRLIDCGYSQGRGHLTGDADALNRAFYRAMMHAPSGEEPHGGKIYLSFAECHAKARENAEPKSGYWLKFSDGHVSRGWQDKEVSE